MSGRVDSDAEAFAEAVAGTGRFAYRHGLELAVVGVAWFVASLPVVTVGPATLGAYAAIDSLATEGRIDRRRVARVVRRRGVHALLLGVLPGVFGLVALLYASTYAGGGGLFAAGLAVLASNVAMYLAVVLVPTFVAMSRDTPVREALAFGRRWTAAHPTLALATAVYTAAVFAVGVALTVGFVVLFPAMAFGVHVAVVDEDDRRSRRASPDGSGHVPI
jgi:hypothetical protein